MCGHRLSHFLFIPEAGAQRLCFVFTHVQVLHANGCAPRLYCTFQNGICYEFMQGDALGPQDVRDPTLIRLIALEMARIHAIHAHNGCIPKPNLWIKMRQYFSLVATEFTDQASNIR
ncbi:Ethanolamine kinase 1 [Goodea atripinnis]|uniref:ethanolamine kinase n=1 Tax=Goodea atripinnis TaxID=208336 RepID=A0ABV0MMB2_9TELE